MKDFFKFVALAAGTLAGSLLMIAVISLLCYITGGEVMP